jgi:DNA primase
MARIYVRGQWLEIDILKEISFYDWQHARITNDKLIACSPFRPERRPSFFVKLQGEYAGYWKDSGASGEYEKGDFITLLSYLREETREETEEYLLAVYGKKDTSNLRLNIRLPKPETSPRYLPFDVLKQYAFRHPYLTNRGISEKVQRGFKIGYDPKRKAVAIPWFDPKGRLINIKFRSVRNVPGKKLRFWFLKEGLPIGSTVFGLHFFYKKRFPEAVIVEAEIDSMTLWTLGIPSLAIGSNKLTPQQIELLRRAPVDRLVVCPDNDEKGQRLLKDVKIHLRGYKDLAKWEIPRRFKDVNEAYLAGDSLIYNPLPLSSLSVKFSI